MLGRPFYLMRRVPGEARGSSWCAIRWCEAGRGARGAPRRRACQAAPGGAARAWARVHPGARGSAALARIAEYRRHLDEMGSAERVLEWALAWLERHAPPAVPPRLIHADFRTGNYLVDQGELAAVLDWEFGASATRSRISAGCWRYWRFGAYEREAGGIGSREALFAGYEAEAGHAIDRAAVPYWEVMGTVRWAVIALMQAARHFAGSEDRWSWRSPPMCCRCWSSICSRGCAKSRRRRDELARRHRRSPAVARAPCASGDARPTARGATRRRWSPTRWRSRCASSSSVPLPAPRSGPCSARFYETPTGPARTAPAAVPRAACWRHRARARASPAPQGGPCETAHQQSGLSFHARAMNAADGQLQKHACTQDSIILGLAEAGHERSAASTHGDRGWPRSVCARP